MLPTHVGVVRQTPMLCAAPSSAPHARGGGADVLNRRAKKSMCSHARGGGCATTRRGLSWYLVPHARGGGSDGPSGGDFILSCSPRTWGGSFRPVMRTVTASCSPRTWGWFGNRLDDALRESCSPARVGGSCMAGTRRRGACAPHARGVVPEVVRGGGLDEVLPTRVGVVPARARGRGGCSSAPHASGGASIAAGALSAHVMCSQVRGGWSGHVHGEARIGVVLPTCVGVVRLELRPRPEGHVLPTHVGVVHDGPTRSCRCHCLPTRGG